jgi:hypothetical protein
MARSITDAGRMSVSQHEIIDFCVGTAAVRVPDARKCLSGFGGLPTADCPSLKNSGVTTNGGDVGAASGLRRWPVHRLALTLARPKALLPHARLSQM